MPNCTTFAPTVASSSAAAIFQGSTGAGRCQGPNWAVAILPFMDQQVLYDNVTLCNDNSLNSCSDCSIINPVSGGPSWIPVGGFSPVPNTGLNTPRTYVCPSAPVKNEGPHFRGTNRQRSREPDKPHERARQRELRGLLWQQHAAHGSGVTTILGSAFPPPAMTYLPSHGIRRMCLARSRLPILRN